MRFTVCWPNAAVLATRRTETASADLVRAGLKLTDRIALSYLLIGFVDFEFAGIDEHHHEHPAREDVVGGDLALVMRVPHEREARFRRRRIRDRAGRRRGAGGAA